MIVGKREGLKPTPHFIDTLVLDNHLRVSHEDRMDEIAANQQHRIRHELGIMARVVVETLVLELPALHLSARYPLRQGIQIDYGAKAANLGDVQRTEVQEVVVVPEDLVRAEEVRCVIITRQVCHTDIVEAIRQQSIR